MTSRTAIQPNLFSTIRKSPIFPILQIAVFQCLTLVFLFIAKIFIEFVYQNSTIQAPVSIARNWAIVLLIAMDIWYVARVLLNWFSTYYIIMPHEFILRTGILKIRKLEYRFEHIEHIGIDQGIVGKLFNYGTIAIFSKDLKKVVTITDIQSPEKYMALILRHMPTDQTIRSKPYPVSA